MFGLGGGCSGWGGQGGCERRIENKKKTFSEGGRVGGGVGSVGRVGSGGGGVGRVGRVREDVNEEIEVLGKIHKKIGGGGVGLVGRSGWM